MKDPNTHLDEEKMVHESAEGRPAHPEYGPRLIMLLMGLGAFVLLVIAFLLGMFVSPLAALVAAVVALLLIAANPVFWASLSRAQERRQFQHKS